MKKEIKTNNKDDFNKPKKEKIKSKTEESNKSPREILKEVKTNPDK